ncbi:MAG: hypothetical protein KGL39_29550 [Patescibacteria group bacterium]|nr:hypothetical protein [Patescibacteria group bacterium]
MNADGDFIEKPFDLDIRPLAKLRGWKMADEVPEMVERVAKAIWENGTPLKAGPWDDDLQLWERADDQEKQICRLQAIAAIAALREPTEVMIKAGDRNVIGGEESACLCAADTIYQAMIDEALK